MGGAEVGEGHSQGEDMCGSKYVAYSVVQGVLGIRQQLEGALCTPAGSISLHVIPGLGFILRLWGTIEGFRTRT